MSGIAIERRGKASVMNSLDTYKCPYYSVWQKKDLKFSCTEEDEELGKMLLQENLDGLEDCGSQLVYTLRFHKSLDEDGFISSKTPYVGSFNFKICDNQGYAQNMGNVSGGLPERFQAVPNQLIMDQLQKMQDQITKLQAKPIEESEPMTEMDKWADRIDAVGAIIEKQPVLSQLLQLGIGKLFGLQIAPVTGGISGIAEDQQEDQIRQSIEVLKEKDPKLADHLVTLANMAINQPDKFTMLINML